jgi:hypothetical protein
VNDVRHDGPGLILPLGERPPAEDEPLVLSFDDEGEAG